MSPAATALAKAIAEFQHGNEFAHRHQDLDKPSCDACNLVGFYAARTVLVNPELVTAALAEAEARAS